MTTHAPNDEDSTRGRCGEITSRDNPVTTQETFENVDCLACIILLQAEGKI